VLVLDNQGRVFMANEAWLGYAVAQGATRQREQEWIGLNYFQLQEAADAAHTKTIHAGIREILAGERRSFEMEVAAPSKDKSEWMYFTATVLQGEWKGVLIARQPITERKLAQTDARQLRSYLDKVLESSPDHAVVIANLAQQIVWFNAAAQSVFGRNKTEVLGQSLESVHPDVRTAVQQLQKDLRMPNPTYEHVFHSLHFAGQPGQRFDCHVGAVRDAEGLQYGYLLTAQQATAPTLSNDVVQRVSFALNGVLDNLPMLFDAQIGERSIALIVEVDSDVPEYVEGDPVLLAQVIQSLVGNAIEYTQQGEVCIRVRQRSATDQQTDLAFDVTDTGAGIAPAQLNHIFQAHSQSGHTGTTRLPGGGLILPVCRRLAQLMGGDITVRSELGKGSTFTCNVPLGQAPTGSMPLTTTARWP
jgi:PAS domain S-box-containing protein